MSDLTFTDDEKIKYAGSIERIAFAAAKFKQQLNNYSDCYTVTELEPLTQQILTIENSMSYIHGLIKNHVKI